ncbi:hypothetical protein HDU84_008689 [Entophlyctis sp. JEL0112]|nr:hypothetical protein HDU84_008689 [Entophlyctis sp. JEL0112]
MTAGPGAIVALAHDVYTASTAEARRRLPLLVAHGLFGSRQNWRSLGKQLALRTRRDVVAVDLRNHGDSPHARAHDYPAMAADLVALCDSLGFPRVALMGHSMGAKTAMHLALAEASRVSSLIAVDMAPTIVNLASVFSSYVSSMREVVAANVTSHKEADVILARSIPEVAIRQFILTNLKQTPDGRFAFRINLESLAASLARQGDDGIAGFPLYSAGKSFDGPSLFIRGNNSGYVPDSSIPAIKRLVPKAQITGIEGAGHWVHSEKPREFVQAVEAFLEDQE